MTTIIQTTNISQISKLSLSQRLVAGTLALLIGLTLIGGIGFANDMAVHNGAHDSRHAIGFPCH
jgi:cobalt transporter subunit CbtB